jgi:hypothetical protein
MDEAYRRFEAWDDPDAYRLPRFVCVFSDRTRASWQSNAGIQRPANVQALYFDVGINEPVDVAITAADVDRQTYLAGDKFPLKVTVRATGSKTSSAINVKVGNQTVTQIVNVEAGSHGTFELEIDSANIKAGLHQAEVSLETDDSWPGNNRRYVTFRIVDKPRILVLCEDRSRTKLLARALRSLNYTVEESTITDSPDLRKFDAVFLAGVAAPPEMLWLDLANYVQEGRGVCIIPPGEEMDRASYNNEAAQKVMPGPVLKQVESKGAAWNFTDLDHLQHPFMTFYRRWLDFDVVLKPGLTYRYWQVPRQGVLVEYDDANRDPAVIERVGGKKSGRVLLLTTPLDVRDPAWINYTDRLMAAHYLALVKSCANYLCTPPESLPLNFQFGQEAAPSFTLGSQAFPKYELAGEGFSEEIRFDEKGRWSAERLSAPGNYSVLGINPETSDKTVLHRFSINISGAESDLTRVPIDEIESALGKNAVSAQDRRHSIADTLDWEEPLELFPWLMIALLFLLAFENLLANRFYRKEPLE